MPDIYVLLNQDTWWVTRELRRVRIENMTPGHAGNSFRMLLRSPRVAVWRFVDEGLKLPYIPDDISDGAWLGLTREIDDLIKEFEERSNEDWLLSTPLGKALYNRSLEGEESNASTS